VRTDPGPSKSDAPRDTLRDRLIDGAHLVALFSFAVVQPLLEVLKGDATFFVARRSQPIDLLALGLGLALLVPSLLFAIEMAANLVSRGLRRALHLVFVCALTALILLPPLKAIGDATPLLLASAAVGGAVAALAYARLEPVRSFLTILSPAPLVFAALFLLHPSISKLLRSGAGEVIPIANVDSDTTVVFVILDELPVTSLVDADWQIDPLLFPNFARLASRATWFRNATSNHHASQHAIPGILTGMLPSDPDLLPIAVDHPRNLFSLLAGSYRMNIWETFSGLWPTGKGEGSGEAPGLGERMGSLTDDLMILYGHIVLPAGLAADLPGIDATWGGFGANAESELPGDDSLAQTHSDDEDERGGTTRPFGATEAYKSRTSVVRAFIDSIDGVEDPTLHFLHILLPHTPWERLPTGQRYSVTNRWDYGRVRSEWAKDDGLVAQSFQRHLLQVGHVDLLLGELIDRLESEGVYDRSLFVLVADHGCSIRPSQPFRSSFESTDSMREVLHVPLLVKAPFQNDARSNDRNVQAMDVLPTIADALGVEVPWEVDGKSAFDTTTNELDEKVIHFLRADEARVVPAAMPTHWPALEDKLRLFSAAPGWDGVYALGPHPELIGRPLQEFELLAPIPAKLDLVDRYRFTSVDAGAQALPAYVQGEITRTRGSADGTERTRLPRKIAVAVNGTVRAVTLTHHRSPKKAVFSALIPPTALEDGRNSVEVFGVIDGSQLAPIRGVIYELEDDRIVASDGRTFELRPSPIALSKVTITDRSAGLGLTGWAADFKSNKTAQGILVFLDGECAVSGPMNHRRPDLDSRFKGKHSTAGFNYVLSVDMPREQIAARVRVFALVDAGASELTLNP